MNFHNITTEDMNNGDGLRTVLWLSGCSHHCIDCQNSQTWDCNNGVLFDEVAKKEFFDKASEPFISGVTFSGGDPLFKTNRKEVAELIKEFKTLYPKKTIWMWTGYTLEEDEIKNFESLNLIDVLVDGEFFNELKNLRLHWKGSSNQRVIDVKRTLESKGKNIILYKEDKKILTLVQSTTIDRKDILSIADDCKEKDLFLSVLHDKDNYISNIFEQKAE